MPLSKTKMFLCFVQFELEGLQNNNYHYSHIIVIFYMKKMIGTSTVSLRKNVGTVLGFELRLIRS